MPIDAADASFGCEICYGACAEVFWDRYRGFETIAYLVDDPHDIVRIVFCPSCGQRYVAVRPSSSIDRTEKIPSIARSCR